MSYLTYRLIKSAARKFMAGCRRVDQFVQNLETKWDNWK